MHLNVVIKLLPKLFVNVMYFNYSFNLFEMVKATDYFRVKISSLFNPLFFVKITKSN